MPKKLCLIHANCQGDPLQKLLMLHPEFGQQYTVVKYTNYLREAIPTAELESCALFLYQPLSDKWDDHASDALLKRVNPAARSLAMPNMLFKGYWPFWTNASPMDFGDAYLDYLIDMGLEKKEILYVCLHSDVTKKFDLAAMFDASIAYERGKEEGSAVRTVDLILEEFRSKKLFNTINHPNRRLLLYMTDGILKELGFSPLPECLVKALDNPYPEFELPIHPQVAAFHGLHFGGPETRYNVYGTPRTYAEYIALYVDCRLLELGDFISYLHLV